MSNLKNLRAMGTIVKRGNGAVPTFQSIISELFEGDNFFPKTWEKNWVPAVNVIENDDSYEIEVNAPGFDKKDFHVSVENGLLTISAENKKEDEEKDKNYTRKEFSYQSFSRSFYLPEQANEDAIDAEYKDGILKITVAKKEEAKPKKVEVKVK
jgi:HSP20 family protein